MFPTAQFVALTTLACSAWSSYAYVVTPRAPPCDRVYQVQLGDTCDGISAAHNASTYQLATANAGVIDAACDNIFAGEFICLGLAGEDCTTTHVVQAGETCQVIADAAGISYAQVLTNNPNVNSACSNIYPGEVLCTAA